MKERSAAAIIHIAWNEYKSLLQSSRLIILGLFAIFIHVLIASPLKGCAVLMQEKLSFGEGFAAAGNSGAILLLLPLFYLAMMADFPREGGVHLFYQIRCSKTTWIFGQMLYALLSAVSLPVVIFVLSAAELFPYAGFSLRFSDAITKYEYVFPERAGDYVTRLLPENLYNQMQLGTAILHTFCLLALYFFLLMLILLFFALLNHRILGIFAGSAIIIAGAAACSARAGFMWLLPMTHTVTWLHYTEFFRRQIFPIAGSYLYFIIADLVLALLCIFAGRRYQVGR